MRPRTRSTAIPSRLTYANSNSSSNCCCSTYTCSSSSSRRRSASSAVSTELPLCPPNAPLLTALRCAVAVACEGRAAVLWVRGRWVGVPCVPSAAAVAPLRRVAVVSAAPVASQLMRIRRAASAARTVRCAASSALGSGLLGLRAHPLRRAAAGGEPLAIGHVRAAERTTRPVAAAGHLHRVLRGRARGAPRCVRQPSRVRGRGRRYGVVRATPGRWLGHGEGLGLLGTRPTQRAPHTRSVGDAGGRR